MGIVIVIVMWERHLSAGMLLRWETSKVSVSLSVVYIYHIGRKRKTIMEIVVIGVWVTEFLKALTFDYVYVHIMQLLLLLE